MEPECSLPHSKAHDTCPNPEPDQSTSCSSILILSSHPHLGLPSGLFLSGFPNQTQYAPRLSPMHATCSAHLSHNLITQIITGDQYSSLSSLLCSFLQSPVTLTLSVPNISLSTLLPYTLRLCSTLHVEQCSSTNHHNLLQRNAVPHALHPHSISVLQQSLALDTLIPPPHCVAVLTFAPCTDSSLHYHIVLITKLYFLSLV